MFKAQSDRSTSYEYKPKVKKTKKTWSLPYLAFFGPLP